MPATLDEPEGSRMERVVKVLPRISGLDREFDYAVPAALDPLVTTGTIVRVVLAGRRVSGWVVGDQENPDPNITLRPILAVTGFGPPEDIVRLAAWAAWRWAGKRSKLLVTASPPRVVKRLPSRGITAEPFSGTNRHLSQTARLGPLAIGVDSSGSSADRARYLPARRGGIDEELVSDILSRERAVVRVPPSCSDAHPYLNAVVRSWAPRGGVVLSPSLQGAKRIAAALLEAGTARTALFPDQWAEAASGGYVAVGPRSAAWAPVPDLGGVVVLDAHDDAYVEERAPTWNAWIVAGERARRAGVGCTLMSACPSLEMLDWGDLLTLPRSVEREGWPVIETVDRRKEDPRSGLISDRLVELLRRGSESSSRSQVVCVLNAKGWAALFACAACGELARCEKCSAAVEQQASSSGLPGASGALAVLTCRRCATSRPLVCAACSSQRLKVVRPGVSRVGEHLTALIGANVPVVTAEDDRLMSSPEMRDARVLVGTEALLNRLAGDGRKVRAVVFLDFDRELLAPRVRAGERAMALLAKAARLTGGRAQGGRILIQTRVPDHDVISAATRADPGRLAQGELQTRTELRFPPAWAVARVSGSRAADFVSEVKARSARDGNSDVEPLIEVAGPGPDGWLLRAREHETLCNVLAGIPRSGATTRIEVDPLRL